MNGSTQRQPDFKRDQKSGLYLPTRDRDKRGCGFFSTIPDLYLGRPPAKGGFYPVDASCILYHAYWSGDAKDHADSNDGTVVGATFVENGAHGDGTDDYIWANCDGTALTECSVFIWVQSSVNQTKGAWQWAKVLDSGAPFIYLHRDGGNFQYYYDGDYHNNLAIADNAWGSVGCTWNDAPHQSTWLDYLNGQQTGVVWERDRDPLFKANTEKVWAFNGYAGYFHGLIGEVFVFNVAKTSAQMLELHNGTKARYGL